MMENRVIAIDGPAGSGKSSVAKLVGEQLGFLHVDSGALYRIMTWQALLAGVDTADEAAVAACAAGVEVEFEPTDKAVVFKVGGELPGDALRSAEVNQHASPVARVVAVRDKVTAWLRSLRELGDIIVEGRDITSVVFPDTPARFYLDAAPEVRALRRHREEVAKGITQQSEAEVLASLLNRDRIDSTRKVAPLKLAPGVMRIDTSELSLTEVVSEVVSRVPAFWRGS
ncbi:MAG: (d)CMP kinase [Lentisphaerae bacterium]|jgi:cytidylate kinase|nr:(d)CMP kinase [Lentisphaerota bacterium]